MRPTLLFTAIALAAAGVAHADKPKKPHVEPGVWASLVQPGATWTLPGKGIAEDPRVAGTITIETYDVRKVGGADVARLRWTLADGTSKTDVAEGEGRPTQVAVTRRGVWFLSASDDDQAIAKALAKKPTYADPVVTSRRKDGTFVEIDDGGKRAMVCVGKQPHVREGCEDLGGARRWHGPGCEASLCVSTDGIVVLDGSYAPGGFWYIAAGYDGRPD
jgi:hypothetical protein